MRLHFVPALMDKWPSGSYPQQLISVCDYDPHPDLEFGLSGTAAQCMYITSSNSAARRAREHGRARQVTPLRALHCQLLCIAWLHTAMNCALADADQLQWRYAGSKKRAKPSDEPEHAGRWITENGAKVFVDKTGRKHHGARVIRCAAAAVHSFSPWMPAYLAMTSVAVVWCTAEAFRDGAPLDIATADEAEWLSDHPSGQHAYRASEKEKAGGKKRKKKPGRGTKRKR